MSPLLDSKNLIEQIRHNCSISDCRYAGTYSVCGWPSGCAISTSGEGAGALGGKDSSVVLEWIGEKEEEWDKLEGQEFKGITVAGKTFDPLTWRG